MASTINATYTEQPASLAIEAPGYSLTIRAADIEQHWHALSQRPDSRARMELQALGGRLQSAARFIDKMRQEGGTLPDNEATRFAKRHVELTRRYWHMESRCASWFVVGPANFPVERNRKRLASSDKAADMIRAHEKAAREAMRRTAWPHGAPGDAIRASNPDAPELLRSKIAKLTRWHASMKAANATIRSAAKHGPDAQAQALIDATGWPRSMVAKILSPDFAGRVGFPDFELSSALAEIKRLEIRLSSIERNRARGEVERETETTAGAVRIVERPDLARIQLVFPGKPDDATRSELKSRGFRWSPTEGAWQRHLNEAGRYAAECVLKKIAA
jgi:hypothetical protein